MQKHPHEFFFAGIVVVVLCLVRYAAMQKQKSSSGKRGQAARSIACVGEIKVIKHLGIFFLT